MTSIFNGRWPEMSSFNIFIKTYLFGLKQTNLCNSRKQFLLTAAEVHKYHSTEDRKKKNTHTMNMHRTHGCVHGLSKGGGHTDFPGTSVPYRDKCRKICFSGFHSELCR